MDLIRLYKKNRKSGFLIFFVFLILHLLPLFSVDVLLTLDGSSHLYNSKLFNEILAGNESVSTLFQINKELVPNYVGHLLLSVFLTFLNPIIALKALHVLYVVGIAFAFRNLVLQLNPKNGRMSVLIFPVVYSMPFISGFYNFSLALIFLLVGLAFWFKNDGHKSIDFYIKLAFLMLLTYFSHSFTFGVLCLSLGILVIARYGVKSYREWLPEGLKLIVAAIIPIVLGLLFVSKRETTNSYLSFEELWTKIVSFDFIFSFQNQTSFWVLSLVFIVLLFSVLRNKKGKVELGVISLTVLFLYFLLPDSVGYASVFSVRTLLITYLFFMVWFAVEHRNRFIQFCVIITLLFYQNNRMNEFSEWMIPKNNRAKEVLAVSELIPANSIIKPIRTLNVWQYFHISNLLGVKKPQIILENYEALHDYFPVKWTENLEDKNKNQTSDYFKTSIDNKDYSIDYLVKIGQGTTENIEEQKQLEIAEKTFPKVYQSSFITLYKVVHL